MTCDCPECGSYTFDVSIMDFVGRCSNCTYEEEITKDTWNLKYDDGYKMFRAMMKYNIKKREALIKKFKLDRPNSVHAKFLLTPDVVTVLQKEAPQTLKQVYRI
ncbi:hypothetical protein KKA03_06450 [archaeon]|nr:hypothetical protein [archaeon]